MADPFNAAVASMFAKCRATPRPNVEGVDWSMQMAMLSAVHGDKRMSAANMQELEAFFKDDELRK